MRTASVLCFLLVLAPSVALAEDCLNCASDSSGDCAGAGQCRGTREHCRSIGCKITGTASCSTAANVKICASVVDERFAPTMGDEVVQEEEGGCLFDSPAADDLFAPAMEDCLMCGSDSSGDCAGAGQCRGTREHCRSIGCKITGTASCSTAANVKICASVVDERFAPTMESCVLP